MSQIMMHFAKRNTCIVSSDPSAFCFEVCVMLIKNIYFPCSNSFFWLTRYVGLWRYFSVHHPGLLLSNIQIRWLSHLFPNRPSVTDGYENRCTLKDKSSVTCVQLNGYYIFVYFLHSTYLLHVKLMVSYCIYKNVTHRYWIKLWVLSLRLKR